MIKRVSILGGGGWGLTIAKLLSEKGISVLVYEHDRGFLHSLLHHHSNPVLLEGVILSKDVLFTGELDQLCSFEPHLFINATPSQFVRASFGELSNQLNRRSVSFWDQPSLSAIVNLAKGIEKETLLTMSEVLKQLIPPSAHKKICTLSGPSHAEEVASGIPTAVVLAGQDEALLESLQKSFSTPTFRCYRSMDIKGVEVGGAIKNIIAIAAGILDGLGFGDNTMGALLTRGIVEIQRLGIALGANPNTLTGLSGMGDLITTAISPHSRNRYVGKQIGLGKTLPEILDEMKMVAEGVETTRAVYDLAKSLNLDMPIVGQIYEVLYLGKNPALAIQELMTRDLKNE